MTKILAKVIGLGEWESGRVDEWESGRVGVGVWEGREKLITKMNY